MPRTPDPVDPAASPGISSSRPAALAGTTRSDASTGRSESPGRLVQSGPMGTRGTQTPADAVERLDAAFEAGGFLVALYATTTTSGRPASSVSRGTGGRARAVPLSRRTTKIYEPGVRIRSGPSTA